MNERDVFIAALQIKDASGRQAYLEEVCGIDVAMRQHIEGLLQANEQAGSFLESPVADVGATGNFASEPGHTMAASIRSECAGSIIGPYKLLQQIGEGGMGTVYMAEQTQPIQRKVALKIIKAGMDSRQVIARFEAERQALAMMDHVNIARVIDAGTTESGLPYFVMELVHGVPITKYCDDSHLTPRERLELFVPVCQAIQHAHQKGIIHRDIKPSNVMITLYDGKPVPKVIDFGVAKATEQKLTERTLFTQYGTVVGTLEYMSPEQAKMSALGVDTRSDIYSLGVLLYELLTGSTPLTHKRLKEVAYTEILRIIKEEEPQKPSTRLSNSGEALASISAHRKTEPAKLSRLMRGELDWIVMKTLEKDRNRRYETANGFAADVQRYLNDETVLACPPSAWYRFRKFVRHHKGLLVATGVVLLTLVAGIIGTSSALIEARVQYGQARQREAQARQSEKDTKDVLAFFEKRVLSAALTKGQGKHGQGLGPGATILDAVNKAEAGVAEAFEGRPLVEASIRRTLGLTYWDMGDFRRAIEQHEKALALRKAHLAADNPDVLESMNNLAQALQSAGRLTEALPLLQETLKLRQARLGPDDEETLWTMNRLAETLRALGRPAEALPLYEEALRVAKIVRGPDHQDTWIYMDKLAGCYQNLARFDEAVTLFEATLKLEKTKLPPDHPDLLVTSSNLALAYADVGRWAEAEALGRETLELKKTIFGFDHPDTLAAMNNLGNVYRDTGRPAEALPLLEEAVRLQKARQGAEHYATLIFMGNLATVYRNLGRLAEASALFDETLRLEKTKLGADHPRRLIVMNEMGACLLKMKKHDKAETLLRECLALRMGRDPGEWWVFQTKSQLGQAVTGLKRYAEAEALLREAYQQLSARKVKLSARYQPYVGEAAQGLASLYNAWGKPDQAAQWREKKD